MKRTFDIIGSLVGLIVTSPIMLVIFILLRSDFTRPVIFSQERIGKGGKPFRIYKFRTMEVNDEDNGTPMLAQENDKRLTRLGKFLRNHHLDEMPQLWNVLIGDMSFVGYRPERKYFIDQIMEKRPDYVRLYSMRPGVTSLATVKNGYTYTIDKMIRRLDMDLEYLDNHSLLTDIKIIFLTITSVV